MVERVHLTPEFVDAALPPQRGEHWIGDLDIQGFGLRLWTTRSGAGKVFAIRTFSSNGITVRRTFDPKNSSEYQIALLLDRRPAELGSYLASARRWAWSEITRLKGLISYLEKPESIRVREAKRRLLGTVQEVVDDLLEDMRRRRLSELHIIRVDKLLSIHLPATIRSAPLADLTPNQIARALSNSNPSPSALRLVRRFVGHIFETAAPAEPSFLHFARDLDSHLQLQCASFHSGFPELEDLTVKYYKRMFQRLEAEDKYW